MIQKQLLSGNLFYTVDSIAIAHIAYNAKALLDCGEEYMYCDSINAIKDGRIKNDEFIISTLTEDNQRLVKWNTLKNWGIPAALLVGFIIGIGL